jgi:catalase
MAEKFSRKNVKIGKGGELHQLAGDKVDTMTTQQGVPIADD